jgi:cytochrome c553
MTRRPICRVAAAASLLLCAFASMPASARAEAAGRRLAASCASCHRFEGSETSIPTLAGQHESHVILSMHAYRSSATQSKIMHVVADALTTHEIEAVAHYLAARKRVDE